MFTLDVSTVLERAVPPHASYGPVHVAWCDVGLCNDKKIALSLFLFSVHTVEHSATHHFYGLSHVAWLSSSFQEIVQWLLCFRMQCASVNKPARSVRKKENKSDAATTFKLSFIFKIYCFIFLTQGEYTLGNQII